MKNLRTFTGLVLLIFCMSAPTWGGIMPTPPAPTEPPAAPSEPVEGTPAAAPGESEGPTGATIAATLLNVALTVADLF